MTILFDSNSNVPRGLKGTNGAAHVLDGFNPSIEYSANLNVTVAGTEVSAALVTGAVRVQIANIGASTENMRFAFGTSDANAKANLNETGGIGTTGILVIPVVDGGQPQILRIPALATHVATVNAVASDTPELTLVQGI